MAALDGEPAGPAPDQGEEAQKQAACQYLTFLLGEEAYGIDILRVQEIKGWSQVTHVPNAPDHVLGVLNLRGAIIPVIDLRVRFAMPARYGPTTVIVVLRVVDEKKERTVGVVVDGVSDVVDVTMEAIRPPPDLGSLTNTEYIAGMMSLGQRVVMLLDIDRLLAVQGELADA